MFNTIFKENIQGRTHPGSFALQNQGNFVTESLNFSTKSKKWPWIPNNSHNYHDENHDEIEFYQGNSNIVT